MKVGITKLVLAQTPHETFFEQVSKAGFECVELAITKEGELTLNTSDADLARLAESAKAHNLEIVSLVHAQCTGNLLQSGDAAKTSIEQTNRGLDIADKLSVRTTLHTLGRQTPEVYYDDAYRNAIANLQTIANHAEKVNVSVAVEFVWNGMFFSPMEMRRMLDEVGRPHIGFYFDPGNMAVFQHPHHWVRLTGPHIKMVHLKDWTGGALNGSWPGLLKGNVDYAAMNRELRAINYDGPMISEVAVQEQSLEETVAAIRKIFTM